MYGPGGRPKRLTVTIPIPTYKELQEFSEEWGLTLSETIRLAVKSNLKDYYRCVRYVDREQAKQIQDNQCAINKNICLLFNKLQDIRNELNMIGINYNQQIKLLQQQKKEGNPVDAEKSLLDTEAVSRQIQLFEKTAAEIGGELCRFQK